MTHLGDGTIATDINSDWNAHLTGLGYTIRHVETWLAVDQTCITWDPPEIDERNCPF